MTKISKKQIILALSIIFVLFIAFVAVSLIIRTDEDIPKPSKKGISISFKDGNKIEVSNKLPISDALGKNIDETNDKQSYIVLTIKNDNETDVNYEILLNKLKINSPIRENYIKFYLTDDLDNALSGFEKNKIPSFGDLYVSTDKPAYKVLYQGTIPSNSTSELRLRVWVSDTYVISDSIEKFAAEIVVNEK